MGGNSGIKAAQENFASFDAFSASVSPFVAYVPSWTFLGPEPLQLKSNFTGTVLGSDFAATGRVSSAAATTGLIVAGTANGGVWISTNGGGTFTPVFDSEPTLAIGAVALDSTTNPPTIYAATGEGNSSVDALFGQGIFKSSNLGQSWTALGQPTTGPGAAQEGTFDDIAFTSLALDTTTPGTPKIFAGAIIAYSNNSAGAASQQSDLSKQGLWFSPDGGNTWQLKNPTSGICTMQGQICAIDDVKLDPLNPQMLYVAVDSFAVYSSTDGGTTFTRDLFPGAPGQGRQSIAVGPPASAGLPGIVYVMIGANDGVEYSGLFVSTDGAMTWNGSSTPTVPSFTANSITIDGTSSNNFSQSFYDQALLVSPSAADTVFFGGVGLYESTDFGVSWAFLPQNGGLPANQHALSIDPNSGNVLIGNDGGLYEYSSSQGFSSLNQTISASMIEALGPHPTNASMLAAGFQSGGTQIYSGAIGTWSGADSESGDGGFTKYDPNAPSFIYHDFSAGSITAQLDAANESSGVDVIVSESSDGGQTWCSGQGTTVCTSTNAAPQWTPALQNLMSSFGDVAPPNSNGGPAFYPPIAVDPSTANRVFIGAHAVYVSQDGMTDWFLQTTQDLTSGGFEGGQSCADSTCALEDIEFAPSNPSMAWALAMSSFTENVTFQVSNTTQANVKLDTAHKNGAVWNYAGSGKKGSIGAYDPTANLNMVFPVINAQATSITPDPFDANVAYLSLSGFSANSCALKTADCSQCVGHIYKTSDFGQTWTEADGGVQNGCTNNGVTQPATALPDVPVLKILVDSNDNSGSCGGTACSNSIFAGTDVGVFHSSDGGATWTSFNKGSSMPTVPVYDLAQNSSGTVFAGTHGRGAYALATVMPTTTPTTTPTATPTPDGARIKVPGALKLKPVGIGTGAKSPGTLVIANIGKSGTLFGNAQLTQSANVFSISAPGAFQVAPKKTFDETVQCTPDNTTDSAMLAISSNDAANKLINVTLTCTGLAGRLAVAKALVLRSTGIGNNPTANLVLKNVGKGVLTESSIAAAAPFGGGGNTNTPIEPGATSTIGITFTPTKTGVTTGSLQINVALPSTGTRTVILRGVTK